MTDATAAAPPRAQVLSIGSELLMGEIVDTNAAFLAAEITRLGAVLGEVRQLPDERATLAAAFRAARRTADLVIATGGLGPTHDDITREALADSLGEQLTLSAELAGILERRFGGSDRMPSVNLRQAYLIPSAEPLANPIGSAPGWWVDHRGGAIVLLPGVPAEMRRMWSEQVIPRLERRERLQPVAVRVVKAFGIGESAVAERLGPLLANPGERVNAGIYARDDGIHIRFATHDAPDRLDALVAQVLATLGLDAYGTDAASLPAAALAALGSLGATSLATIERGTGGALLSLLAAAEVPAGAAHFTGGRLSDAEPDGPATADPAAATLTADLEAEGRHGRSRVRVELRGPGELHPAPVEVIVHGSGPQRMRRAAHAALDFVRRSLSPTRDR